MKYQKMNYREYKRASLRHYNTCQYLCNKISTLSDKGSEQVRKKELIHNVYYLSGYIIETLLSYILFSTLNDNKDVELSDHYKSTQFKTHDLNKKIYYLQNHKCLLDGITFIGKKHSNKKFRQLFNNWNVQYRYEQPIFCNKFTEDDIMKYINEIGKMCEEINRRYY